MPFRPPNFSPVLPLSTGSALSKSLAEILQRFGVRKDREKQQNQELSAALELQNLKHRNQIALKQIESKFRAGEDVAQFERGAPERAFKQTELTSEETQKGLDRESRERIARIRATRTSTQDRVAQRTVDKENRAKLNSLGGRTIAQLADDLRTTSKASIRDKEGKLTGGREFKTPEHEQQFGFTKNMLEMKKAGLNDRDLESLEISPEEAISRYAEIKQVGSALTLRPGKPGQVKKVRLSPLTNAEIVKLMRAGLTSDQINNGIATLKQNSRFAKFSDAKLLKLLLRELNK